MSALPMNIPVETNIEDLKRQHKAVKEMRAEKIVRTFVVGLIIVGGVAFLVDKL